MERAYRRIMTELLDEVVTGTVATADWLPKVHEIAARHACSPSIASQAIRALEERRVIQVHPGKGQQVLDSDSWDLLDPDVAAAVLLHHRDTSLLREAVDALRLVETEAAMLAARRVRDGDVAQLRQVLGQMRPANAGGNGATDLDHQFGEAEIEFHRALMLISGNRFLASMLKSLHPVLVTVRQRRAPDRDPVVLRLHERILAALRARDVTATAAAIDDYGRHMMSWLAN